MIRRCTLTLSGLTLPVRSGVRSGQVALDALSVFFDESLLFEESPLEVLVLPEDFESPLLESDEDELSEAEPSFVSFVDPDEDFEPLRLSVR